MIQCFVEKEARKDIYGELPELVYISRECISDRVYPRIMHAHEDLAEFILIRDGEGSFLIDGEKYDVKKGDLVVINSGVIHDESGGLVSSYCCAVSGIQKPGMKVNTLISKNQSPVIHTGNIFGVLEGILGQMFYMLCGNFPKAEICCESMMDALLMQIDLVIEQSAKEEAGQSATSEQKKLAKQIRDYIDQNYMNDVTLGMIANELHISLFYLSHVFKDVYDYSPIQYLLKRRIGEAQSLLIQTDLTITRIAMIVGIGNPNYFNIVFSKNVGLTPSAYRKLYRSRQEEKLSYTIL